MFWGKDEGEHTYKLVKDAIEEASEETLQANLSLHWWWHQGNISACHADEAHNASSDKII